MRLLFAGLLLWCGCAVKRSFAAQEINNNPLDDVHYDLIDVWPMPSKVQLPESPRGPHALSRNATIDIDSSCDPPIKKRLQDVMYGGKKSIYKATTRTYAERVYSAPDNATCPTQGRCMSSAECKYGVCYVPSERWWSRATPCTPSSKQGLNGCGGCCVPSGLSFISKITVTCAAHIQNAHPEGYTLTIETGNGVSISSSSSQGAAYGLVTLSQLLRWDEKLATLVLDIVPLTITDEPALDWRGLMMDTSRHYIPLPEIKSTIRAMHQSKLNRFHWHIVDSPSFPYMSDLYPELAEEGSWSGSKETWYDSDDIREIAEIAADHFIQLVLEFDTPAHTLAIGKSHPEMLTDCWKWMAESGFKVDLDSDDAIALDPTSAPARSMIANLLEEAAGLLGSGKHEYLHIGGDEVKFGCWNQSSTIQDTLRKRYGNLSEASFSLMQAEWTANVSAAAATRAGLKPVLWQPTSKGPGDAAWDDALPLDSVYMVWLNADSAARYAEAGKDVVYTTPYYVAGMGSGGWNSVYNAGLIPKNLSDEARKHFLGAEVCAWGESMDISNTNMREFQIGAGAAESFWLGGVRTPLPGPGSAKGLGVGERYDRFLCHLLGSAGVKAGTIMPSYCAVRST